MMVIYLTACSLTKVQLYTEGMTEEALTRIEDELKENNFKVVRNELPVPEVIRNPLLVFSYERRDLGQVIQLDSILESFGYELQWVQGAVGDNFYSKNDVGLYLIPYQNIPRSIVDVKESNSELADKEYVTQCLESESYLTLYKDLSFRLESLVTPERLGRLALIEITGGWRVQLTGEELELAVGEELYVFTIDEFEAQALQGTTVLPINGITLINNSEVLGGCDYVYRSRAQG